MSKIQFIFFLSCFLPGRVPVLDEGTYIFLHYSNGLYNMFCYLSFHPEQMFCSLRHWDILLDHAWDACHNVGEMV